MLWSGRSEVCRTRLSWSSASSRSARMIEEVRFSMLLLVLRSTVQNGLKLVMGILTALLS